MQHLIEHLDTLALTYTIHEHEPVFTVEEGAHISAQIPGAHSKNLFVRDKKKQHYFLITVRDDKRVDLKAFSKQLGMSGLSFASPDDLLRLLSVTPGSVTPFALLHDTEQHVTFILDDDFLLHDTFNFHPLRNDMTLNIEKVDFFTFYSSLNRGEMNVMVIPERS